MSCAYEEDLTAYVDGELSALRQKQVSLHLPGCGSCRGAETLLRRTLVQLETLPAFEASPGLRRQVLHRIDEAPRLIERLRGALSPAFLMPSMGLAAAALVAVAVNTAGKPTPHELDPGQMELAANLDVVEDFDVLGLDSPEDIEVLQHLQELEAQP